MTQIEIDELDWIWVNHCRGCRNMKCNNSYNEIAKCKGKYKNRDMEIK
jgi:hypothetical protein